MGLLFPGLQFFSERHLSEIRLIVLDVFTQLRLGMNESKSSLVSTPPKLPKAREEMELLTVMSDCLTRWSLNVA